jgi:sec-independent protein translocase protein TatA
MPNLKGWEWLIIVALILLLFGAKRLPDAARGLGRSLRIFKAETKGLADDAKAETTAAAVEAPPATPPAVTPPAAAAPPAVATPPAAAPAATPPAVDPVPTERAEG